MLASYLCGGTGKKSKLIYHQDFDHLFFLIKIIFRLIKLTSPKLNYVILLGSTSAFLSIILYSYPSTKADVLKFICPVRFY